MLLQTDPIRLWKMLFASLLVGYCLAYAPYGTNETDGGFLTGLAWQVLQGKVLYHDVIYVRPPLPVWLRAIELRLLPETWAILGERWIFFGKVALYAWLGAATLAEGQRRWILAVFGFVVSVHCYTPMAWHTVDGILFAALAFWLLFRVGGTWGAWGAGIAVVAATLCKQSFYPLPLVLTGILILSKNRRELFGGLAGIVVANLLFFSYLLANNLLSGYRQMVGGAAATGQAMQHGLLDYLRINPLAAALSAILLPVVGAWFWQKQAVRLTRPALWTWIGWLAGLMFLYVRAIWQRQDFTAPFAQARLLFDVAVVWGVWGVVRGFYSSARVDPTPSPSPRGEGGLLPSISWFPKSGNPSPKLDHAHLPPGGGAGGGVDKRGRPPALLFFALLSISWCAGISWGYNLPILFAVPLVFVVLEISDTLWRAAFPGRSAGLLAVLALTVLLAVFRYGYEFVYRDGLRSTMNEDLGAIFPALTGVRTDAATADLYRDLRDLAGRYGPDFKTLPSFPQANFLTKTRPRLPLDWVVQRETNGDNRLVLKALEQTRPVFFIEKSYPRPEIETHPELTFTREILEHGTLLEETPHFWVVRYE